jgi:hypothetical protein
VIAGCGLSRKPGGAWNVRPVPVFSLLPRTVLRL